MVQDSADDGSKWVTATVCRTAFQADSVADLLQTYDIPYMLLDVQTAGLSGTLSHAVGVRVQVQEADLARARQLVRSHDLWVHDSNRSTRTLRDGLARRALIFAIFGLAIPFVFTAVSIDCLAQYFGHRGRSHWGGWATALLAVAFDVFSLVWYLDWVLTLVR